jgi:GTP-binding protein EngB required for normal cell division
MSNPDAKNWDFFDQGAAGQESPPKVNTLKPDDPLFPAINTAKKALANAGLSGLLREIEKIERSLQENKFKISVVGEFSKGKSTFINLLFGREVLPVGNLPTTAILTKVTYSQREMLVFVDSKGIKKSMPLESGSWEGLTADIKRTDPQGVAFVGINDAWLAETGMEIIDTPGAGDLDPKRTLLINDALLCGDGAVITISALQALSMSEREFIEQRLLAAKIPCLLLIVTHLDNVKPKERAKVIQFIKDRLSLWKLDVPVFIPHGGIEIPDMDCSGIMGIEAVKAEMSKWVSDAGHGTRKRESVCAGLLSIMDFARTSIAEKEKLLQLDKEERDEALAQRKLQLSKVQVYWEDLRLEIMKRGNNCYQWLRDSVKEKTDMLVERLQYEASHAGSPQKWWEEDYPYRLKVEMMNLAASLEGGLTQLYNNDIQWLNDVLDKQFKLSVFVDREVITDKILFRDMKPSTNMSFENLEKKRTFARIGTGVATIAGFALFAASGMLPIAASIAIGTGGTLISEKIFKGKIDDQRKAIKDAIANDIPRVIDSALSISEQRLKDAYDKITKEASAQEEMWVKSQLEALAAAEKTAITDKKEAIAKIAEPIEAAIKEINKFITEEV